MPRYKIDPTAQGLKVSVNDVAGHEPDLLRALQECKEGHCSCPTAEYEKLAGMEVHSADGAVQIELRSKTGVKLEAAAVERCLDYTMERLATPK